MVEQHSASASLPLTFSGTVQWQLHPDLERMVLAHVAVSFTRNEGTYGSPSTIACSISLVDVHELATIAQVLSHLALVDDVIPNRQYFFNYAHTLVLQLIRMGGEVYNDTVRLVEF